MVEIHEEIGCRWRTEQTNAEQTVCQQIERLHQLRAQLFKVGIAHDLDLLLIRLIVIATLTGITFAVNEQTGLDKRMNVDHRLAGFSQTRQIYAVAQLEQHTIVIDYLSLSRHTGGKDTQLCLTQRIVV